MRTISLALAAVATLAACGDDDGVHHLADAPRGNPDAAVDAAPDAPPGPVTITVVSAAAPLPGVEVYFQAPDSTEILTTTTDAQGSASAMMPHGGFVTALDPFPDHVTTLAGDHLLKTYANVKPGDHLVLNDNTIELTFRQLTVALPLDAAAPLTYEVYTDCGAVHQGDGGWGELSLAAPSKAAPRANGVAPTSPGNTTMATFACDLTGTATFVVLTKDSDGAPLNVAVAPAVSLATSPIDLTAATFAPIASYDFAFANGAAFLSSVDVGLNFLGAAGEIGTAFSGTTNSAGLAAGAGTASVAIPTIAGTMPVAHLALHVDQTATFGNLESYQWGLTPTGTTIAMDLTNRALVDYATEPAFDPASHTVTWTTNAGASPNAYFVETAVFRTGAQWQWDMVGAYAGAALVYPVLPGDGADYNPVATDEADVEAVIVAAIPIGYDAVRPHAYDVIRVGADLTPLAAGTSGHFETNTYTAARGKLGVHASLSSPRSPAVARRRVR